jgi:HAD superfamily hydrolase (TIGR01509 family)
MNLSLINAVLFDVDGVLYDSMPLHARAWVAAFQEQGKKITQVSVYEAEGMKDHKAAAFIAKFSKLKLPDPVINRLVERKKKLYEKYPDPKPIKGAKPLIKYLQKNNYKIGIVTGSNQKQTVDRLKKDFGIERKNIITGQDVTHGKPHPEPFLKALKKLKVTAKSALVVENAPLGIQSAKRAKIKCIALKTGPLKEGELLKAGAKLAVKDCAALLKLFEKTN